ncbi:MAG: RIP metalloprotease RseP [Ruminococcaceae bacterium]|nr:RIP metalloprotease RseP [Oscillospiraceae bacterium]
MSFLSILLALLIFGVLIFIHELGHFLVARAFGVQILEFAIGMGPKLFSFVSKKSGTRYSLRLIPIGGFVSMLGENGMEAVQGAQKVNPGSNQGESIFLNDVKDENHVENTAKSEDGENATQKNEMIDPELAKHAYCNKSVWVRMLISLAGPLMNLLLGFLLMMVLVISAGPNEAATTQVAGFHITYNAEESYAGLQKGDYLYMLKDGPEDTNEQDDVRILSTDQLKKAVAESATGEITFSVLRLNADRTDTISPNPVITIALTDDLLRDKFATSLSAANGENAGLMIGDIILKVNNTSVHTYDQLSYEIMNQGYQPIDFTVERNGEKILLSNITVPRFDSNGVTFGEVDFLIYREANFHFGTILKHTFFRSVSTVKMVFDSIKGLFIHRYGFEALSGPIGITKTISDVAQSGQTLNLLYLVIVISINLGVMNLLPFPALDGGHLLLYIVEAVRRKPIRREVEGIINFVGLILILLLAVIIAVKDIISL